MEIDPNFEKEAGNILGPILPTGEQFAQYLTKYGPTAFGVGATTAGVLQLLAMAKRIKQENQDAAAKPSAGGDVMVVHVKKPTGEKVAADREIPTNYPFEMGLATAATVPLALGGYSLVNYLIDKRRKQEMARRAEKAKSEYADLLAKSLSGEKTAGETKGFSMLNGLITNIVSGMEAKDPSVKTAALTTTSILTSWPSLLAVAAGLGSYGLIRRQEKELDKHYNESKYSPPKQIKIVTDEDPAPVSTEPVSEPVSATEVKDKEKKAEIVESIEGAIPALMMGHSLGKVQAATKEEVPQEVEVKNDGKKNTITINTSNGPVQVEGLSPEAVEMISKHKDSIIASITDVGAPQNKAS
jgi:hypothetical protein